jgi:hypothetical protein
MITQSDLATLGVHAEADWQARGYICSGNNF